MALNPVERRLVELGNYWRAFCDDASKRLLIWRVQDNALRMLQCFFEVQKLDSELATGDLFIVFDTAFENSIQYSRDLKLALAGQYEASRDDLTQQGITPDWSYLPESYPDTATGFVQSLCSFEARHQEIKGHVAAVLMPSNIADNSAFQAWLQRALEAAIPERLRLAVIDTVENPQLLPLIELKHPLVFIDSPPVDALSTAQETFAQEGGVGPAAVFRNFLIGLVALIAKGTADQVKAKSKDALAFARKQKWLDQEVVVAMLVAGALLKEKRFAEAISGYKETRATAQQAADASHPAGKDLVLQTWFGQAGAHLAAGETAQAADCYDQAALVAKSIPNLILAIEAHRMAMFCHARLNNRDPAIERGTAAMGLGEQMEPDMRNNTTLPIAAVDYLRVIELDRVKKMEAIKQRRDAGINQSREHAEQQAAQAEKSGVTEQLKAVESKLADETARAEQAAARELDALVTGADPQFRGIFAQARGLLGAEWPLENPVALPMAPALPKGGASA